MILEFTTCVFYYILAQARVLTARRHIELVFLRSALLRQGERLFFCLFVFNLLFAFHRSENL